MTEYCYPRALRWLASCTGQGLRTSCAACARTAPAPMPLASNLSCCGRPRKASRDNCLSCKSSWEKPRGLHQRTVASKRLSTTNNTLLVKPSSRILECARGAVLEIMQFHATVDFRLTRSVFGRFQRMRGSVMRIVSRANADRWRE